ncbi:hypothetical protein NLU13_5835 [Sarocladium strictum]|uniref:Uncharacterized protein n=1 Tax=Sarocladium strictum TaxID=5046 RepID=A0AA39L6J3_SARSR|nr:hypothetical protein NLU13_5835 [Sarocladium strictum]
MTAGGLACYLQSGVNRGGAAAALSRQSYTACSLLDIHKSASKSAASLAKDIWRSRCSDVPSIPATPANRSTFTTAVGPEEHLGDDQSHAQGYSAHLATAHCWRRLQKGLEPRQSTSWRTGRPFTEVYVCFSQDHGHTCFALIPAEIRVFQSKAMLGPGQARF